MIAPTFCHFGRMYCDNCPYLTTGGCIAPKSESYSITAEQARQVYERQYNELMQLSKETLVELIIGKRYFQH